MHFRLIQYVLKVLKADFTIQYCFNTFNTAWKPCSSPPGAAAHGPPQSGDENEQLNIHLILNCKLIWVARTLAFRALKIKYIRCLQYLIQK